jgi:hypothetical protein
LEVRVGSGGELHIPVSQDSLNAMDVDAGAKKQRSRRVA